MEMAVSAMRPEIHPADSADHPHLKTLLAYWQTLKGHAALPARPTPARDIAPLLKRIHVSDVIDGGGDFRFRILGDAVFQCHAENQTGKLVSQHPDVDIRMRYPILMRETVRKRAPVRGLAVRTTRTGRFVTDSIWLPFGDNEVAQIMGLSVLTQIAPDASPERAG